MAIFVRKNIVKFSTTFAATDGSTTQPSAANAVVTYADLSGASHQDIIALTYNATTSAWEGTWDSSASGDGTVHWMVYGYGTLQGAAQGSFEVSANTANTV